MIGVSSNYVNSLTNSKRYDYSRLGSPYNNTPIVYGSRKQQNSYVNDSAMQYVQSIQNSAKSLNNSIGLMSQQSTFDRVTAISSNNSALRISSSSNPTKDFQETKVEIDQIAKAQVNQGSALKAGDTYAGFGTQRFEIEVDGRKQQFSVRVERGDTNRQVQQKMADAINSSKIGVTASVSVNSSNKTSTLNISSKYTGDDEGNRFTVRDVSGSLVEKTGVAAVSQQAQNAIYRVNGEERVSQSNVVDLGNGVSATLRAATDDAVTVSLGHDKSYAISQISNLVSNYNQLLSAAEKYTNGNTRLLNDLTTAYTTYSPALERIGISQNTDGTLSIDRTKLETAAQNGKLEQFFTENVGKSYGFTNRLSRIASNAQANPTYYVASAKSTETYTPVNPYNYDTNNILDLVNSKSFNLKTYNQWYSLGYLFDMFI